MRRSGEDRRGHSTRLVLFDLDDTLFDHTASVHDALGGLRTRFAPLQRRSLRALVVDYGRYLEEIHPAIVRGEVDPDRARRERFARLFASCDARPTKAQIGRLTRMYQSLYRVHRRTVPGAKGVLLEIRREAMVGVLSNNRRDEQLEKMSALRLGRLVDFLVTSEELHWEKPDPRAFRAAARLGGVEPAATTMVGDSWSTDVAGALRAGLSAVWLNRRGEPMPRGYHAVEIRGFRPVKSAASVILSAAGGGPPDAE